MGPLQMANGIWPPSKPTPTNVCVQNKHDLEHGVGW